MKILSLDLSTSTGYALVEGVEGDKKPTILEKGTLVLEKPVLTYHRNYPWNYLFAADAIISQVDGLVNIIDANHGINVVVIEETNLGKNRYAQKTLEWIHHGVVSLLLSKTKYGVEVVYLSSSSWRQALGLTMTKDDKKNNKRLSDAKVRAKVIAQQQNISLPKALAALKKEMGIRGKVNKKHVALRWVNDTYGLNLKQKDDDIADAICIAVAALNKATPCDGI